MIRRTFPLSVIVACSLWTFSINAKIQSTQQAEKFRNRSPESTAKYAFKFQGQEYGYLRDSGQNANPKRQILFGPGYYELMVDDDQDGSLDLWEIAKGKKTLRFSQPSKGVFQRIEVSDFQKEITASKEFFFHPRFKAYVLFRQSKSSNIKKYLRDDILIDGPVCRLDPAIGSQATQLRAIVERLKRSPTDTALADYLKDRHASLFSENCYKAPQGSEKLLSQLTHSVDKILTSEPTSSGNPTFLGCLRARGLSGHAARIEARIFSSMGFGEDHSFAKSQQAACFQGPLISCPIENSRTESTVKGLYDESSGQVEIHMSEKMATDLGVFSGLFPTSAEEQKKVNPDSKVGNYEVVLFHELLHASGIGSESMAHAATDCCAFGLNSGAEACTQLQKLVGRESVRQDVKADFLAKSQEYGEVSYSFDVLAKNSDHANSALDGLQLSLGNSERIVKDQFRECRKNLRRSTEECVEEYRQNFRILAQDNMMEICQDEFQKPKVVKAMNCEYMADKVGKMVMEFPISSACVSEFVLGGNSGVSLFPSLFLSKAWAKNCDQEQLDMAARLVGGEQAGGNAGFSRASGPSGKLNFEDWGSGGVAAVLPPLDRDFTSNSAIFDSSAAIQPGDSKVPSAASLSRIEVKNSGSDSALVNSGIPARGVASYSQGIAIQLGEIGGRTDVAKSVTRSQGLVDSLSGGAKKLFEVVRGPEAVAEPQRSVKAQKSNQVKIEPIKVVSYQGENQTQEIKLAKIEFTPKSMPPVSAKSSKNRVASAKPNTAAETKSPAFEGKRPSQSGALVLGSSPLTPSNGKEPQRTSGKNNGQNPVRRPAAQSLETLKTSGKLSRIQMRDLFLKDPARGLENLEKLSFVEQLIIQRVQIQLPNKTLGSQRPLLHLQYSPSSQSFSEIQNTEP